jgi:hypothetical protein
MRPAAAAGRLESCISRLIQELAPACARDCNARSITQPHPSGNGSGRAAAEQGEEKGGGERQLIATFKLTSTRWFSKGQKCKGQ